MAVGGIVHGGQQPISGSTVQMYAASSNGPGGAATALLNPALVTDASGSFNLTGKYVCPSPSALVYVVATSGDPGIGASNSDISLMTALGACGNLSSNTRIVINELTTVAAAFALEPYMTDAQHVGYSGDSSGIQSAFNLSAQLVGTSTGLAGGASLPAGQGVPTDEINALGNILAACVNSRGGSSGDGSACGDIFSLTGGGSTSNTIAAILHIARNPSSNLTGLYQKILPNAPFSPSQFTPPSTININPGSKIDRPVISPNGGGVHTNTDITITDTDSNATIYYTTDGTPAGTGSNPYHGAIHLLASGPVRAVAVPQGSNIPSAETVANFTVIYDQTVAKPTITPGSTSFTTATLDVTLDDATPGADIYYTTDGNFPSKSSYSYTPGSKITIGKTTTIKAAAFKDNYNNSDFATATFTQQLNPDQSGVISQYMVNSVLSNAVQLVMDPSGDAYVMTYTLTTDFRAYSSYMPAIVKISKSTGATSVVAGNNQPYLGGSSLVGGSVGSNRALGGVSNFVLASDGTIYFAETEETRVNNPSAGLTVITDYTYIWKLNPSTHTMTAIAGGGSQYGCSSCSASQANPSGISSLALDDQRGVLWIVNSASHFFSHFDLNTTTWYTDLKTLSGYAPSIAVDSAAGYVYYIDGKQGGGENLQRYPVTGGSPTTIGSTKLCVNNVCPKPLDGNGGPIGNANIDPSNLTVGPDGSLYLGEGDYALHRKVKNGTISIFAGQLQGRPSSGDGGLAVNANVNPTQLSFDPAGNAYFIDTVNGVAEIRRIAK